MKDPMPRANHLFRSPIYSNGAYFSPSAPAKSKVVSIPIQFVRSDYKKTADPVAASISIQKAFRGFVVRKNVEIVRKIESEIDDIELKFRADQGMDRIVRDEKERLTINEMLMRLLFRLDSVRGVRDYRKRVIRRVIVLQEMVDSISAARSNGETFDMTVDQAVEEVEPLVTGDQVVEFEKTEPKEEVREESNADGVTEESKSLETGDQVVEKTESTEKVEELNGDAVSEASETLESADPMEISRQARHEDDKPDACAVVEEAETPGTGAEEVETRGIGDQISRDWELLEDKELNDRAAEIQESARVSESTKEDGRMKEVMERMVTESEKLKGLVAELCERSAQQCRLMGGLAERVEHLEKMVEKMERRRKKRRKDSSTSPASSLDKKCGKDKQSQ